MAFARWIHKTSNFENQQGLYPRGPQGYNKWRKGSLRAHALRTSTPTRAQCWDNWKLLRLYWVFFFFFILQDLPGDEGQTSNITHIWVPLNNSLGMEHLLHTPPLLHPSLLVSPGKELVPSSGTLILVSAAQVTLSNCMIIPQDCNQWKQCSKQLSPPGHSERQQT